ncbi:MAG: hypothetical protein LBP75_10010 [Planctomycetota bacterium]|nr:hypothetical protein [Planctomycetota bacterium]
MQFHQIKKFLVNHGEKIVFGLVTLGCISVIWSRMTVSPYDLLMSDGTVEHLDPAQYRGQMSEINDLLNSEDAVREKEKAKPISRLLARDIVAGIVAFAALTPEEWWAYVQPPPIGIPQTFREVRALDDKLNAANIPPQFRTRFGNAENLAVRAALGQVIVTATDSRWLNFPQPGSRRMLLYRKAIGSPHAELPPETRAKLQISPRAASLATADGRVRGGKAPAIAEEAGDGLNNYKLESNRADVKADRELSEIIDNHEDLLLETAWELVSDNMRVVKINQLTESDYESLFEDGLSPDLVEMSGEEIARYRAERGADAAQPAAKKDDATTTARAKRRQQIADLAAQQAAAREARAEDQSGKKTDAPQTYLFIDKDVNENMIYRYAVVAAVKPRYATDPDTVELIRAQNWDLYCELDGIDGVGDFAPAERLLEGALYEKTDEKAAGEHPARVLLKEFGKKSYGIAAPHLLEYIKPAYDEEAVAEYNAKDSADKTKANGPAALSLRNDKGRLTPLGWAYRNQEYCFADFVASDLVITPQEYDFSLLAVTGMPSDPLARVEVFKTAPNGDVWSTSIYVRPPVITTPLVQRDLLTKDANDKVVEPIQYLPLLDVYNSPKMSRVRPAAISETAYAKRVTAKGSVAARENVDFAPNWGLVEIRPYKVRQQIYTKDRQGEWRLTTESFLPSNDANNNYYALIIAEIKVADGAQRRVRRLFRPLTTRSDNDQKRYEYEYLWEYDIYQKNLAKEAARNRAGE